MTYATKLRLLWLSSHFTVLYSFLNSSTYTMAASIVWAVLVVMIGGYAGWHRYFIHRSYQTGSIRKFILLWLGAIQGIGKPITICAIHRWHHQHSDTEEDIHSPTVQIFRDVLIYICCKVNCTCQWWSSKNGNTRSFSLLSNTLSHEINTLGHYYWRATA